MIEALHIDDDQGSLNEYAALLKKYGVFTVMARTKDEGLMVLKRQGNDIKIVLLDYRLAGAYAPHVLEEIRKQQPDIPVIILTHYSETAEPSLCAGADDFVTKDRNRIGELNARIWRCLEPPGNRTPEPSSYHFGVWTFDVRRRILTNQEGTTVGLTPKQQVILREFLMNPGVTIKRSKLEKKFPAQEQCTMTQVV